MFVHAVDGIFPEISNENKRKNIYSMLALEPPSDGYEEMESLFNANMTSYARSDSLKRMKFILGIYDEWISASTSNKGAASSSFYEAVNVGLASTYCFKHLLSDFVFMTEHNEMMMEMETEMEHDTVCDAQKCYVLERNERERGNENMNSLFFVSSDIDDESMNDIVCQETMDSIHCFVEHKMRISTKQIEERLDAEDGAVGGGDDGDGSLDKYTETICSLIEEKQKSLRFRKRSRFKHGFNKFVTTDQSVVYGNESLLLSQEKKEQKASPSSVEEACFVEALCMELEETATEETETGITNDILAVFAAFIVDEEYDSEAIEMDFEDKQSSNIIHGVTADTASNSVYSICSTFIRRCRHQMEVYSSGYRYFYWPYYRDNQEEQNVVFKASAGGFQIESNPGYSLCEWFISAKYSNLKEEALQNDCASFSIYQYELTLNKAKMKLNQWENDKNVRRLENNQSRGKEWTRFYGVASDATAGLDHIIALLFYCNFTKHSFEFSRTYRRIKAFESDRSLKRRHSEVAVWGQKLRELIECFGLEMKSPQSQHIDVFYHGINSSMVFNSTMIKLNGPVSTTLGVFVHVPLSILLLFVYQHMFLNVFRFFDRGKQLWIRGHRGGHYESESKHILLELQMVE